MKKIVAFVLMLIFSATTYCQNKDSSNHLTRAEYLKKSKSNKIGGFILLGVGTIALVSASGGNTDLESLGVIVVAGSAAVLGSIPLFIAASKNKRKATNASVYFKMERMHQLQNTSIYLRQVPVVGISIKI